MLLAVVEDVTGTLEKMELEVEVKTDWWAVLVVHDDPTETGEV
jgi:hypothetical protein